VPIEKLLDWFLKCHAILEKEAVETIFQEETDANGGRVTGHFKSG
jgi:hypothetical protein